LRYYLLLIITFSLMLSGCGNKDASTDTKEEGVIDNEVEEKAEESELAQNKKLDFTTQDVMGLDSFKDVDSENLRTYDLEDGMKVETMQGTNIYLRFFVYYLNDSEYPSAFFLTNTNNDKGLNFEVLDEVYAKYNDEQIENIDVLEDDTDDYHVAGFIFNEEIGHSELPFSLSEMTEDDFLLKGIDKKEFNKLNDSADYKELIKIADEYIEENEVNDYDSVNDVMAILEPIRNQLDEVEVKRDDFDNSAIIYYKGLTDISADNYVVPFIKTSERFMELLVGFEKDGWLFADKYTFNVDGETHSNSSIKFDHDTIGGEKIRETYTSSYKDEIVESIINGDDAKLRFEGDKGKLDYTLTDKDKDAIEVINSFNELHHDLSDLIYSFYN